MLLEQIDPDTWIIRRYRPQRNAKILKIPVLRRLPDDPEWDSIYFDLIGLPPTLPEVSAFLTDGILDDIESVVDHLLESPHYGERLASYWLDVVRYADTDGYGITVIG